MSTLAEERVLKPLNPVPKDVNEWPDFTLADTKVFYQGKGRYASLLEASNETPLCVVGVLAPVDDDLQDLVLREDYRDFVLKIENVTRYSFGQDENERPIIWAAGKAGWYEISPSTRYQSYFDDSIEAVDLFHFVVEQHQKLPQRRQKRGFQIDPFLTEYQHHTDYRIDDNDEAMEALHKHHKFLLKQMFEKREGIDWSNTHLWRHLAPTYPEEVERLERSKSLSLAQEVGLLKTDESDDEEDDENGQEEGEDEDEEEDEEEDEDEKTDDDEESEEEQSSSTEEGSVTNNGTTSPEPERKDWTQTIWEILSGLRISGNVSLRHCTIDKLAEQLQDHPTFHGDHEEAMSSIERSAESLLALMNQAKLKKKFNWTTRPIYSELEATLADEIAAELKTPAPKADKRHRQKSVLRPSGHGSKANKRAREVEDSDDEDELFPASTPGARTPVHRRVRFSSDEEDEEDEEDEDDDQGSPSRQLNGDFDALPVLPPPPETQEMLDLVKREAKAVGRQRQVSHLEAFLGSWTVD